MMRVPAEQVARIRQLPFPALGQASKRGTYALLRSPSLFTFDHTLIAAPLTGRKIKAFARPCGLAGNA